MPRGIREGRSLEGFVRNAGAWLLLAALALVLPAGVLAAEEAVTKYFVHVLLPSPERIHELIDAGFDIAGVDKGDVSVGVVATDEELKRLRDLGFSYSVERSNKDAVSIQALSDYTDPQELSAYMDQIVAAYPNLAQKSIVAGPLFDGQYIYALKLTSDVGVPNDRPSFILDAQHHAREVMTPEIAKDMIDYITTNSTQPSVLRWLDSINIYIVGSVNPDGAMYVFNTDNMWRKNRHPGCPVDLNRNYPFAWGSCNGSSPLCTDDTNRGPSPGSEPETQGMLQLVAAAQPFFTLSYHSYGEYMLYPYGCSDPDELAALGTIASNLNGVVLNDAGTTPFAVASRTGPIWSAIYRVDGGSIDTQYALYGAYGFSIEVNSTGFQPDYATWRNITVQRQRAAWQYFLNYTLDGPQIRGTITDMATGLPLSANVAVQEVTFTHGEAPRHADTKGKYHWLARNGQAYHLNFTRTGYCAASGTATVGTGPFTLDVAMVRPTPPVPVSASAAGDNQIDVSWSPTLNATEYRVFRSLTSGGPYTQVGTVTAPDTVFHDTTVSGSTTYYYVVKSYQPCESAYSAETSALTTGVCFVGPAFSGLSSVTNTEATTCTVDLAWAAAGARCNPQITYRVHRSTAPSFTPDAGNLIASGLTATTFTDIAALVDGTPYYYLVRAVDGGNGMDDGNTVILSTIPTGPVTTGTWTDDAGDTGTAKLVVASPWSVQATGGKTAPHAYATGTYTNNLCAALTTPTISVLSGASLSFATKYDIEGNWDAGIVEVAQGPAFSTWSRLTTVNYPDALLNPGTACSFPRTFTGTVFSRTVATPAYAGTDYTASLAAYAGKDVKLRFKIGSDSTGTGQGWWVDDISVTNATFKAVCSSGAGVNPKEVSPAAAPMTASRAASGTGVDFVYTPACGAVNNAVYWGVGPIAGSPVWTNAACALGNTGVASFDPGDPAPGGFFYFVIVGQNLAKEGSYGQGAIASVPTERPEAVGVGACDKPQDLTGDCP